MKLKSLFALFIIFIFLILPTTGRSGESSILFSLGETNSVIFNGNGNTSVLFYAFDLRERETYVQFTFPLSDSGALSHIQIFDVSNNCNENNFFDVYTPSDTHIYNLRNIQTNDGNPSGVVLPDNSYGIVVITSVRLVPGPIPQAGIGNFRILDNNGYEYRTNAVQYSNTVGTDDIAQGQIRSSYFNFNTLGGVTLSDIMGISVLRVDSEGAISFEWQALPVQEVYYPFDVDIYDLNEVPFSCRDVVFSCVNDENPLLEELLANSGTSVASFEYGINNAIPHTKSGELLCPGNNISNGTVVLTPERIFSNNANALSFFTAFIGLNNGNGRGSMDSIWSFNWVSEGVLPLVGD